MKKFDSFLQRHCKERKIEAISEIKPRQIIVWEGSALYG